MGKPMIIILNHLRALQPVLRPINILSLTANFTACTADESSGSLRFFRPWLKKNQLNKVLFLLSKPDLEFRIKRKRLRGQICEYQRKQNKTKSASAKNSLIFQNRYTTE